MTNKTQKSSSKIRIVKFQPKYAGGASEVTRETFKKFVSEDCTTKETYNRYLDFHDFKKRPNDFIRRRLERICYVVLADRKVVGTILGDKSKIINLYVLGKYLGRGIGKNLLNRYEKEARKFGSKEIKVFSSSYAKGFYKKCGFKKTTGVRVRRGIKGQPMKKILD